MVTFRLPRSCLCRYHKKKYVWKLVYIFVLGYEVDFGHNEAIQLMTSQKFSEKSVGYVAVSLMIKERDEEMEMVINSIKADLGGLDDGARHPTEDTIPQT